MGVPGFMKFIQQNSKKYLRPLQLSDTVVVIDGNNVCSLLYVDDTCISAFGGEYSLFYSVVKRFFTALKQCNVTPIVIFDGAYAEAKLRTIKDRLNYKIGILKRMKKKNWHGKFTPMFLFHVFCDVLAELRIERIQWYFDADLEIAAVARDLGCPVISSDSDFFFYDVLFIPYFSLKWEQLKNSTSMECSVWTADNLVQEFPGLRKPLLPLLPALIGNDYLQSNTFRDFVEKIASLSKEDGDNEQYDHKKIVAALRWLQGTSSLEFAKEAILKSSGEAPQGKVLRKLSETFDRYSTIPPSSVLPLLRMSSDSDSGQEPAMNKAVENEEILSSVPPILLELFRDGKLCTFILGILLHNMYIVKLQIEDLTQESSSLESHHIISSIWRILSSFTGQSTPLCLFVPENGTYQGKTLNSSCENPFTDIDIRNVMSLSKDERRDLVCKALKMDNCARGITKSFDNDWSLFIASLLYWMDNSRTAVSQKQLHALLLTALVSYLGGDSVNEGPFAKPKEQPSDVPSSREGLSFSNLLLCIPNEELLTLSRMFDPYKIPKPSILRQKCFVSVIHSFASVQSIIFHITQLNVLLDCPFPDMKITNFFSSGILLCNIYFISQLKFFISQIEEKCPTILRVYNFLLSNLNVYLKRTRSFLSSINNTV